jgi:hypothetical protein
MFSGSPRPLCCWLILPLSPQVPLIDGMDWLVRSVQRRPVTVVRAVVAAVHDAIRG